MARLTRSELKEDKFVTSVYRATDYLGEHKSVLFLGIAGILAIVLVVGLYQRSSNTGSVRADEILFVSLGEFDLGKFQEASAGLTDFLDRFPRHDRSDVAALALGNAQLALNQPAEARVRFEQTLKKADKGSHIWVAATTGLGQAALAEGKSDEAARYFEAAADGSDSRELAAEALVSAIQARFVADDYAGARTLIERVQRDFDGTAAAARIPVFEGMLAASGG